MRSFRLSIVFMILAAIYAASSAAASKGPPLEVKEVKGTYQLTVPVSRLVMTIPKQNFERKRNDAGGSADSPRYFYFLDRKTGYRVSGWFEPAEAFSGMEKFWKAETDAWNRNGLPEPKDVAFQKIGKWDSIIYDMTLDRRTSSHIRGHWVQAGTWIDIHLSVTTDRPSKEQRAMLTTLLKGIEVKEKKP